MQNSLLHHVTGHKAYLKGSKAFHQIVETFGQDVIGDDGEINRKVLGPKVFASKVRASFTRA